MTCQKHKSYSMVNIYIVIIHDVHQLLQLLPYNYTITDNNAEYDRKWKNGLMHELQAMTKIN